MERLTKKAVGCFRYDLKDHKHINGEFGDYDAFFDYNMNEFVNSYKTMRDNEEARVRLMCGTGAIHPERAAEITKAEAEGRLLVLPCKVGETIYYLNPFDEIEKGRITMIQQKANGTLKFRVTTTFSHDVTSDAFGKSVFRTREEAEAALKEREGNG